MWEYKMFCTTTICDQDLSADISGKNLYQVWTEDNQPVISVEGGSPLNYINALGKEGWELVSAAPLATVTELTHEILFTFKRPIKQE